MKKEVRSEFAQLDENEAVDGEKFTEATAAKLIEMLTEVRLNELSRAAQTQLAGLAECFATVTKQTRPVDDNAVRFMLFSNEQATSEANDSEPQLTWREINWAYHSNSQDTLVELVGRQFQGRTTWEDARETGIFMWMTDATALVCVLCQGDRTYTDSLAARAVRDCCS